MSLGALSAFVSVLPSPLRLFSYLFSALFSRPSFPFHLPLGAFRQLACVRTARGDRRTVEHMSAMFSHGLFWRDLPARGRFASKTNKHLHAQPGDARSRGCWRGFRFATAATFGPDPISVRSVLGVAVVRGEKANGSDQRAASRGTGTIVVTCKPPSTRHKLSTKTFNYNM